MKTKNIFQQLPEIKPDEKFKSDLFNRITNHHPQNKLNFYNFVKYLAFTLSLNIIALVMIFVLSSSNINTIKSKDAYVYADDLQINENTYIKINNIYASNVIDLKPKLVDDKLLHFKLPPGYYYAQIITDDNSTISKPIWVSSLN